MIISSHYPAATNFPDNSSTEPPPQTQVSTTTMARFSDLPHELLLQILGYLTGLPKCQRTLSNLCSVSRYFLPVARERPYAAPKAHWLEDKDL